MNQPVLSKEQQEKLAQVDFGLQVQAFLGSRIGKYLVDRASREVEENTTRLKAHPILKDPAGAAELQLEIKASEKFLYWLGDAVREGAQLMEAMMAEERQALGLDEGSQTGDPTGN